MPTKDADEKTTRQQVFITRIMEAATVKIGGKSGVNAEVLWQIVKDDPESAAEAVSAISRQADVPVYMAQIAYTIAAAYENLFEDDSLSLEVAQAPWAGKYRPPQLVHEDGDPLPPPSLEERVGAPDDHRTRIINIDPEDLRNGSIETLLELFSLEPFEAERLETLTALWGNCVLAFPLDDDPRYVAQIPSARAYLAKLHAVMPYFPCYLNFRQEAGMFQTYFASLADLEAFKPQAEGLDLVHKSLLNVLVESLIAIGCVADLLNKDPRPVWRGMLAVYPSEMRDNLIQDIYIKMKDKTR